MTTAQLFPNQMLDAGSSTRAEWRGQSRLSPFLSTIVRRQLGCAITCNGWCRGAQSTRHLPYDRGSTGLDKGKVMGLGRVSSANDARL